MASCRQCEIDADGVATWAAATAAAASAADASTSESQTATSATPPPVGVHSAAWRVVRVAPLGALLPSALLSGEAPLRLSLSPGAPPATVALLDAWAALSDAGAPVALAARPLEPAGPEPQPEIIIWHSAGGE